jgi:hypothetical protein
MQDEGAWADWQRLRDYLAVQLTGGRLALVLGAGISIPIGLPSWSDLVNRAFAKTGLTRSLQQTDQVAAETLFAHVGNDETAFAELIRGVLYDGIDLSMTSLRNRDLLAALGALTMGSNRGSVTKVLTFNFDDLLERFLTYYGFFVEPVVTVPAWGSRVDTRVYHIHGLLPSDLSIAVRNPIVMTQKHFDDITGKDGNVWRSLMVDLFQTHTCIFIGLSGNDNNLSSALTEAQKRHACLARKDAFWGVRFCLDFDPMTGFWQQRGVYCCRAPTHDSLPTKLFEICQTASERWHKALAGA